MREKSRLLQGSKFPYICTCRMPVRIVKCEPKFQALEKNVIENYRRSFMQMN